MKDGKNDKDAGERSGSGGGDTATAMRKGPWTEEEDAQLVRLVRLFGERRWDFLAKVSGLRRTGKSCRLRWVNYLHPGLRRGRITADEERLILQLHAQWGSRWSRIAQSLPGRTDNEIKNFWRTRTRKKALEERRRRQSTDVTASPPPLPAKTTSACPAGSPTNGTATATATSSSGSAPPRGTGDEETTAASQRQEECNYTSMDHLWSEIEAAEAAASYVVDCWGADVIEVDDEPLSWSIQSPAWEMWSGYPLWTIDDDDEYYKKMIEAS